MLLVGGATAVASTMADRTAAQDRQLAAASISRAAAATDGRADGEVQLWLIEGEMILRTATEPAGTLAVEVHADRFGPYDIVLTDQQGAVRFRQAGLDDQAGALPLPALPAGVYTLSASRAGGPPQTARIELVRP